MTVREEVFTQVGALVTAAFGLVAALVWNGTIQALFWQIFGTTDTITGQLIYAILVTIGAVIATIMIARSIAAAKGEEAPQGLGSDWGKKVNREGPDGRCGRGRTARRPSRSPYLT